MRAEKTGASGHNDARFEMHAQQPSEHCLSHRVLAYGQLANHPISDAKVALREGPLVLTFTSGAKLGSPSPLNKQALYGQNKW